MFTSLSLQVVDELEVGRLAWVQPWRAGAGGSAGVALPRTAVTHHPYSEINGAPYRREKKEISNER